MALFVEGAAAPARYLLVTEPSAVKKRQVKAWSELGTRAGRTRKVREVRTRTTRATTCLLSCMAAANVGLWPGASQGQAVDGEQKEVTIWSAKVVAESDSHGDAESELGYPNVTTAVGYYNFPFLLDAGSITDDDFVWKGRTQTVISLAQMSEGEVTGKAFNGDPIIAYDTFWTELQLSPGVTRDADVTRLTLYIDGKKLSFSHDPGCSICSSTWERQSTTPAYLWRYGPPTPVRITELRTNQAATVSLPMIDATGGFHVGQTLIALRSRVADGNGTTGSTFKSQWFHVDEDGGNRTAITGVMDDRTYKLKIPDFGKHLQAAIIFTDDDTFAETVYSEIVGPITSVPWQPENLTATPATESVSLSWTPGGDNGSPITSYQVRYRKGNGAWSDWTTITGSSASTTSHEVTGLDENSSYTLEVRAVNDAGGGVPAQVQTTTLLVPRATITGVTISSDPNDDGRTGNDDTYAFGDTITLEITFSKAIDVTQGAPQAAARRPPYVAEEGPLHGGDRHDHPHLHLHGPERRPGRERPADSSPQAGRNDDRKCGHRLRDRPAGGGPRTGSGPQDRRGDPVRRDPRERSARNKRGRQHDHALHEQAGALGRRCDEVHDPHRHRKHAREQRDGHQRHRQRAQDHADPRPDG